MVKNRTSLCQALNAGLSSCCCRLGRLQWLLLFLRLKANVGSGSSSDWSPQHHGDWAGWQSGAGKDLDDLEGYFPESAKWMLRLIAPGFDLPIPKLWNFEMERKRKISVNANWVVVIIILSLHPITNNNVAKKKQRMTRIWQKTAIRCDSKMS